MGITYDNTLLLDEYFKGKVNEFFPGDSDMLEKRIDSFFMSCDEKYRSVEFVNDVANIVKVAYTIGATYKECEFRIRDAVRKNFNDRDFMFKYITAFVVKFLMVRGMKDTIIRVVGKEG
jgi:hypothetical protein